MELSSCFRFDFVKSRKHAGPQKQRRGGMRKRVAFVGGSGAFQPEIACHKIKSFWILLASKVSKKIVLYFYFFFPRSEFGAGFDEKRKRANIRWMFELACGWLKEPFFFISLVLFA